MMLVQPGSSVRLAFELIDGVDDAPLRDALEESTDRAGWKISDDAPVSLVAIVGRGPTETVQYTKGYGAGAEKLSAKLTPFTAKLEIRDGANVLWSYQTRNYVPPSIYLKPGQTLQEAISEYEKPGADFFRRLALPPRIPRPATSELIRNAQISDGRWKEY